jgi:atrial natriuretic peptide receptor B
MFVPALKIHISKDTKEALDEIGTFQLELRGVVDMKV